MATVSPSMQKMFKRWNDPARPTLLPKNTKVGRFAEILAIKVWTPEKVQLLNEFAKEFDPDGMHEGVDCDTLVSHLKAKLF
jgi:hypothetical protein